MAGSALLVVLASLLLTAVGLLAWGVGRMMVSVVRFYWSERTSKIAFQHPVYGILIGERGYWSGSARSGKRMVPFGLDGDGAVPNPGLIERLDSIIRRLGEVEGQAVDFLRSEVADLAKAALELYRIEISNDTQRDDFVLEFVVSGDDSRSWQVWRVEFESGKPRSFGVDD